MADSSASDRVSFVSKFNRILAVVVWALCAFVVTTTFVASGTEGFVALVPALLIALAGFVVLWRPRVDVDDDGVLVTNPARRILVPWSALIHVDTKFALTLHTPGRRYTAFAAPAPGRTGAAMARRQSRSGNVAPRATVGGKAAPGDLLTTDSGAAADLVRDRWETLREAGRIELGTADTTKARIEWLWQPLVGLAVLLAGTIVVLALQ